MHYKFWGGEEDTIIDFYKMPIIMLVEEGKYFANIY